MKTITTDIRFAEDGDAAALASIHADAWLGAYRGIIPHRSLAAMVERRGPGWWRQAIGNHAAILILEFGGEIAGYATLGRNRTKALSVQGEIYEIYLRPKFQGIGFGKRLFDAARSLLRDRGMGSLAVWALSDNEAAVGFYGAVGGLDIAEGEETFEDVTLRKVAFVWN